MAGAYCRYCDRRCFVLRELHMATCAAGMANDRQLTGHDHTTAINPMTEQLDAAAGAP